MTYEVIIDGKPSGWTLIARPVDGVAHSTAAKS